MKKLTLLAVALCLFAGLAYAGTVPIGNLQWRGCDGASCSFSYTGNNTFQGKGYFLIHACKAGQCGQAGGVQVYKGPGNSSFLVTTYYQNGVRLSKGSYQLRVNWCNPSGGTLAYKDSPVFTVK